MPVIFGALIFCWAAAPWAPDTGFGKVMRQALIEAPARKLAQTTPLKLAVGIVALASLFAFMLSAPELVPLIGFGDLALYFDAAALTLVMGAVMKYKSLVLHITTSLRQWAANAFCSVAGMGRKLGTRRVRSLKSPTAPDDKEPEPAWAFAFA